MVFTRHSGKSIYSLPLFCAE